MAYPDVVLADEPVAYYRLGDLGSTAVDSSGNGHHATIGAGASHSATGAIEGGQDDGGLLLTGSVGSEFTTPSAPALALPLAGGAIEGWLLWTDTLGATLRDHSGEPFGDSGWLLAARRSGDVTLNELFYRVGSEDELTGIDVSVFYDRPRHYIVEWDATGSALYMDGRLVHESSRPPGQQASIALPWHVGKNGELPDYDPGLVDEVAFYDHKLGPLRAHKHFCAGWPSRCRGWLIDQIGLR